MKLRLFALRSLATGKFVKDDSGNPLFYNDKPAAKKARDTLTNNGTPCVVTAGPDHRKFRP